MENVIFNETEALDRLMDMALLKELLQEFSFVKELKPELYESAMQEKDYEELDRLSHSLKGVAGNLSLVALYKTATEFNSAVRLNHPELLDGLLEKLKTEIQRFAAWLPEYLHN